MGRSISSSALNDRHLQLCGCLKQRLDGAVVELVLGDEGLEPMANFARQRSMNGVGGFAWKQQGQH